MYRFCENKLTISSSYKLEKDEKFDLIIFGLGRFGMSIANKLDNHPEIKYLAIDFDPEIVKSMKERGKSIIYGELDDPEIIEQLSIEDTKCIISTISDGEASMKLIKTLRRNDYQGKIYLTAENEKDFYMLAPCNADEILFPQKMAASNFYNYFLKNLLTEDEKS